MTDTRPGGRVRRFAGPRRLRIALAALVLVPLVGIGTAWTATLAGDPRAGAASLCQSSTSLDCTASLPCPESTCPTVNIDPVNDVESGQYLFLKATDFPVGDTIRVALCSTSTVYSPDPSDPFCLHGTWIGQVQTRVQVPVADAASTDDLTQISMPVFQEQSGDGNTPLPSSDILGNHQTGPGIFCDDTTDPCAVDVTLEQGVGTQVGNGPAMSSTNTLSFPITFTAGASGCPSTDPTVQVDGSYSVEHFMPSAVDATCSGSKGVVALDTTNDNESIIKDFIAGNTSVAFLDTPSDPSAEAQLVGQVVRLDPDRRVRDVGGFPRRRGRSRRALPHRQLQPHARHAVRDHHIGLRAAEGLADHRQGGRIPGYSDNLIAGMAQLDPPVTCTNLVGCYQKKKKLRYLEVLNELQYDTFDMLNPVGTGVTGPGSLGSFMSNVANGGELPGDRLDLFRTEPPGVRAGERDHTPRRREQSGDAPRDGHEPGVVRADATAGRLDDLAPVHDPDQPDGPPWVFPTCNGYSTFPAIAGTASYAESQTRASRRRPSADSRTRETTRRSVQLN